MSEKLAYSQEVIEEPEGQYNPSHPNCGYQPFHGRLQAEFMRYDPKSNNSNSSI